MEPIQKDNIKVGGLRNGPIKEFVRGPDVNVDTSWETMHVELRPRVDSPPHGRSHIFKRIPARKADL
jgi:hypothetical protein